MLMLVSAAQALVPAGSGISAEPGINVSVYAKVARPTALTLDPAGRLWVATADGSPGPTGRVSLVATVGAAPRTVIPNLRAPLGLLWLKGELYVSSTGRLDAYSSFSAGHFAKRRPVVTGLPTGLHQNDAVVAGPDGRLYMGLGSPCDACVPKDPRQAAVLSFRPDGSDLRVVARGLRNPYGLAFIPGTQSLFITENGRDGLGLNAPPEELNRLEVGGPVPNFGYPGCWGQGGAPCTGTAAAFVKLAPHASPDAVAVISSGRGALAGTGAYVAQFGSSFKPPTGRNVVRVDVASRAVRTVATGFANPLSLTVTKDQNLLVGDFSRGIVYLLAAKP